MFVKALYVGIPLAFSYHSAKQWREHPTTFRPGRRESLAVALDDLNLVVTALWPVKTDSHMGLHADDGNCEWDLIVVCRKRSECEISILPMASADVWVERLHPLFVRDLEQLAFGPHEHEFGH